VPQNQLIKIIAKSPLKCTGHFFQSGFLRNIDNPPDKSMTWSLHTDTTPAEPNQIQLESVKGHPFIWPAYNMRWDICARQQSKCGEIQNFVVPVSIVLPEVTHVGWLALLICKNWVKNMETAWRDLDRGKMWFEMREKPGEINTEDEARVNPPQNLK